MDIKKNNLIFYFIIIIKGGRSRTEIEEFRDPRKGDITGSVVMMKFGMPTKRLTQYSQADPQHIQIIGLIFP